jgi:hypothetical protein
MERAAQSWLRLKATSSPREPAHGEIKAVLKAEEGNGGKEGK